jgi:hypothetical protein
MLREGRVTFSVSSTNGWIMDHAEKQVTPFLVYKACTVTSQDFIKFWGKIFAFILYVMIENSQRFKTLLFT